MLTKGLMKKMILKRILKNKRGEGGLSIILSLLFIFSGAIWILAGLNPLLEYNFGSIIAPIVFSLVGQIISNLDFKSPLFSIIIGLFSLVAFMFVLVGWDYRLFVIGFICNAILYIGMWFDDTKNLPGVTGVYTFLTLFISIILASVLVVTIIL